MRLQLQLFLIFFSANSLAYEVTERGSKIIFTQEYNDQSSMQLSFECYDKGDGLYKYGYDLEINPSRPIDMRIANDGHYKVFVGGYEACREPYYDSDERICQNLDYDLVFNEQAWNFSLYNPVVEIKKLSLVKSQTDISGYSITEYCPSGWEKYSWNRCSKLETIQSFDVSWFKKAEKEASQICAKNQDKVTSHIKRLLDW